MKFDAGNDPVTRKRRIRYASFKGTKRDAQIELARLVSENASGESVDPTKTTVAEYLQRWERDWATLNVSAKTLERYSELIRKHVVAHIGHVRIQKLRPVVLADLYAKLMREGKGTAGGLAPRTVGHVHRVLHRAFHHAAQWGVVSQNIVENVCPPPVESTEVQILRVDDVKALLKKLDGRKGHTLYTIAVVLLSSGIRRGELLALRWKDVDMDGFKLRVDRSLEQTKQHGFRFKSPKTKHGRRSISLPPAAVTELRAHWKVQQELRLKLGQGKSPDDALIFSNWDGSIRSPDALTKEWTLCMGQIGMPGCTLHSLRHTHASQLIESGMDILTISRRLGHGSPGITLGVYGHLFSNSDDRAAQVMEAAFTASRTE